MELENRTPFAGFAFRQFDQNGDLDCVVALRGGFLHQQDAPAQLLKQQPEFEWTDTYAGDPHQTPLLRQTDLTPGKVGTDITFLGESHAPDLEMRQWECGMTIGPISKRLTVTGAREWQPVTAPLSGLLSGERRVTSWEPGVPEIARSVPMCWTNAWGGPPLFGESAAPDDRNRIGKGNLGPRDSWRNSPMPAPQITCGEDMHQPAGLAPIPPFWSPRYRFAGTYDEAWRADRHPLLPVDFDRRFWQCAPADQIAQPYLQGHEAYSLLNLHPEHPVANGYLPALFVIAQVDDGPWTPLQMDGVQFDWREDAFVHLTWRLNFPLPDAQGVKIRLSWGRYEPSEERG